MTPTLLERSHSAIAAMQVIGIDKKTTVVALRKLLPQFNSNWELIEDEHYRVLADFIFEHKDLLKVEEKETFSNKNITESSSHGDSRALSLSKTESFKRKKCIDTTNQKIRYDAEKKKKAAGSSSNGEEQVLRLDLPRRTENLTRKPTNVTSQRAVQRLNTKRKRKIDPNDISNGHESVAIKLVQGTKRDELPSFYYIAQNIVFKNAHVNFSLDRIGDESHCPNCFGDCLTAAVPCACARETGGEYAYTREGLVREDFLDSCISRNENPKEDHIYYCKDCPLEKIKNEVQPERCKGHIIKRFIKECWSKCGCSKQCGNRVVQRGITRDLQVFNSDKRKGWGLRSTTDLPKGSFICEYVGEILTNNELFDRTINATCNDKHTYPVMLDADWACEQVLEDEEALCLDATYYGNVARFVNHSCDPNLVAVPVEIESPDHHYYHLAFFTMRKIKAYEELCWDYGIDFGDESHPIKAFTCACGSKKCRDINRNEVKKKRGNSCAIKQACK